jgi:hypothetical protein
VMSEFTEHIDKFVTAVINSKRVRAYSVYKEWNPSVGSAQPIAIFRDRDTAKEYRRRMLDLLNSAVIAEKIYISDNIWGKE